MIFTCWLVSAECGGGELEGDREEEHLQGRAQRIGEEEVAVRGSSWEHDKSRKWY